MKRIQPERFVGAVFGAWAVKALAGRDAKGAQLVDVVCQCGAARRHRLSELRRGKSKSCGCLKGFNVAAARRGTSFVASSLPVDGGAALFDLDGITIRAVDVARFKALFAESDQDACWPWRGDPNQGGYGRIAIGGRHVMAHRLALSLRLGRAVPVDVVARHSCDNRICVNGNHLLEGTQGQNVQDAVDRRRMAAGESHGLRKHPARIARGERHGMARLSDEQVAQLRADREGGLTYAALARKYEINPTHARDLALGRKRQLPPAAGLCPKQLALGAAA